MTPKLLDVKFPFKPHDPDRSPDVDEGGKPHLTTIIKDLLKTLDQWPYSDEDEPPYDAKIAMEMGFIFEEGMERDERWGSLIARPEEVECDGIVGSPDGIYTGIGPSSYMGEDDTPHQLKDLVGGQVLDYKMTKKSARLENGIPKFLTDNPYWYMQAKGYCKLLGMTTYDWAVCLVNGDYQGRRPWDFQVWREEFEQWEIEENWTALVNHAKSKGWVK